MAKLRKSNRVLEVKDDFVDSYLLRGYDLINEQGQVVQHATGGRNVSVGEYNKVIEENVKLKEEIKKLKAENTKLKSAR